MSMQVAESQFSKTSPVNWALKIVLCAVIVGIIPGSVLVLPYAACAQDDIAAADSDLPVDTTPRLTEINQAEDETTRLILRSIRDANPSTPVPLAKAAQVMIDIELYSDARFYLNMISQLGLNDQQWFDLHEAIGSDFFALIQANEFLQPEGKTLSQKALTSATKIGLDPARIDRLVKTLNNSDISVRSTAFRKLRRLGEPAVAELLNVFAQDDRKPDFPGVRGALQSMDPHSQGPMLGAARASDLQVKTEAIRALGNFRTPESLDVMMWAYLSPKSPEFVRRIALDGLNRSKYPADPDLIEARLYERSREYLLGNRQVNGALMGTVTVWNWDGTTKKLVSSEVDPATAARVLAARRAAGLYEIRPDLPRNREMYLLTHLESAKRLVGPSRKLDTDTLLKSLDADDKEIESLLSEAMKLKLVPAAIACCEILEKIGTEKLLTDSSGQPRPLVQAMLFGDRHLQFAAMQAIANIDPQQAFAGSSYLLNLAVYLAQSENRPAALIGHSRDDLAQTYAATLAASGVTGRAVSTSREFFRAATANPDIEFLLVTDTLGNPNYGDLIQQLRNDWRTRRLPIAFLFQDINRSRRIQARLGDDPLFSVIPFSTNPKYVDSHVQRMIEKIEPWQLTNFDRRRHGAFAVSWLAKIAGDRDLYAFYDLGNNEQQLVRLLYLPGFSESASKILLSLGTPTAQRELVNFASQNGLPVEEREKVVEAFVRAVQNGGTLLTTKEIQQQYDRYNASKNEPETTQKVLGSILDAIEARKRAATSTSTAD